MDNATKEIVERVNKELGPHIKGYLRKEEYGNLRIMEWAQEGGDGKIRWELNFDDLRGGTLIINLCYRADKKDIKLKFRVFLHSISQFLTKFF